MARPAAESGLPRAPIHVLTEPLVRFLHVEAAGGVVLLACAAAALVIANSPASEAWLAFWKTPLGFELGDFSMRHSLKHWVNDGLMPFFFFLIGLEVKRELVLGELRDPRRAVLPMIAALGGMVVPAGIYLLLQTGQPGARGWGIPMATDIAFVVGCMALLGPRVPSSLRVMLLSLAIVDDIGAILVIALGYTESIAGGWLALAAAGLGLVLLLSRLGVRSVGVYVVVGGFVWLGVHESGVHATIAGVILGLMTPAHVHVPEGALGRAQRRLAMLARGEGVSAARDSQQVLREVELVARESVSPLRRLETRLHPWSSFAILPLFALANAGVAIEAGALIDPVALAVGAGLVVGKPLGLLLFSGVAVAAGVAQLPQDVGWGSLLGAGFLAGIGFTMALFIAGLALSPPLLDAAKLGVLVASLVAGATGMGVLWLLSPGTRKPGLSPG
jgi:NhaA family Na+:H+ antiporter